jgi:hypothetical protein
MPYLDTLTENSFEPAATGCDGDDVGAEVAVGGVDTVAKVGLKIVVVGCDVTTGKRGAD